MLRPDTTIVVTHGKKSKRIVVSAKTEDGKTFKLKFRKLDNNKIRIKNKVDSVTKIKVSVVTLPALEEKKWYKVEWL